MPLILYIQLILPLLGFCESRSLMDLHEANQIICTAKFGVEQTVPHLV